MTRIDETGKRYGRLIVLHKASASDHKGAKWMCRCDCGQTIVRRGTELRRGSIVSCARCVRIKKTGGTFLEISRGNALDKFDEDIL